MKKIEKYLKQHDSQKFKDLLFSFIDERHLKDPNIYNKVGIDRRLFSKIRCQKNYQPSKKTIIKLGISLELSKENLDKLLQSAGYALSNNREDLIITYCIDNKIYNLDEVNNYLYTYSNALL